jgi:septal ring factor EnvC (AmiA/AmiB activator)
MTEPQPLVVRGPDAVGSQIRQQVNWLTKQIADTETGLANTERSLAEQRDNLLALRAQLDQCQDFLTKWPGPNPYRAITRRTA